jgi:hypothetical protein
LADATSERGIDKLLEDIKTYYPMQGMPSLKFEYVSGDIVRAVLARLGFEVMKLDWDAGDRERGRDLFMIAELRDLAAGEAARPHLHLDSPPPTVESAAPVSARQHDAANDPPGEALGRSR